MISPEACTIIIPHLGETPEAEYALDQCLKSLDETAPNIKRIIVKNGEKCGHSGDVFREAQGQCGAVNAGMEFVDTPWVLVTNDDMIYPPDWWKKLTDFNAENIKCISPKLVEPRPGAPTFLTHFCGGAGGDFNKEKFIEFTKQYEIDRNGGNRVKIGPGFNLPFLISKELWDTVGGYDEEYDPWGSNSDSDLEYRIKLAGVQPLQNQEALVYHFSQTSGTFLPVNDSHRFRNYAYFKEKWGFDRTDSGIWEATFTIPTKEEGRLFNPAWEGKYGH